MLVNKKQVLKLGNSIVASNESFEQKTHNPKTLKTFKKAHSGQFLAYTDILSISNHVLKLGNSIVDSDMSFEPKQNKALKPSKA